MGARQILAAQPRDSGGKVCDRMHGQAVDQCRFGRPLGGAQCRRGSGAPHRFGEAEHAARRPQASVERDLADDRGREQAIVRRLQRRHQNTQRHREIGRRALLAALGGRQVHRDAAVG